LNLNYLSCVINLKDQLHQRYQKKHYYHLILKYQMSLKYWRQQNYLLYQIDLKNLNCRLNLMFYFHLLLLLNHLNQKNLKY